MGQKRQTKVNTHKIDLGQLQTDRDNTLRDLKKAQTLLDNAQQQFDKASHAFGVAHNLLKNATRTVLTS